MIYERTLENVKCGQLTGEINTNSNITPNCIGVTHHEPDTLLIEFSTSLSAAEETELDDVAIQDHVP